MASAEPVRRYTDEEVNSLLECYRKLFPTNPTELWDEFARYLDFERTRPWSCLATNFYDVSLDQIHAHDAARQAWRPAPRESQETNQENGEALARLAREHGCGCSIGINRWTDSALLDTVRHDTQELIVLVGHDWYPIVEQNGRIDDNRLPLDIYQFLDSTDSVAGRYNRGVPSSREFCQTRIGLLYLNLAPDFRPPHGDIEGRFPFDNPNAFGYPHCAQGLQAAIKLALTTMRIVHVVTWGSWVWEALREHAEVDQAVRELGIRTAANHGGANGFPWRLGDRMLRIYPFPHPARSGNWSCELRESYCQMWNQLLNANEAG